MAARREQETRSTESYRIAIIEDHLLQRQRTEQIVNAQRGLQVVCGCETLPELIAWLSQATVHSRPHLLILDLVVDRGPDADPDIVRTLVTSGMRVLVLSALTSPKLVQAVIRAGVGGVVSKRDSPEQIVEAVWAVLARKEWMTPALAGVIASDRDRPLLSIQEERALVLYASGLTMEAVADSLGIKPDTAKTYLKRVKSKYSASGRPAHSKLDLMRAATRDGYLDVEDGEA